MIKYNPKEWIDLILDFHRSDTFRMLLPAMIGIAIFSFGFAFVHHEIPNFSFISNPVLHSLLGFVISLLLVFRTNTAYERWWEARKLWGSLVNNSRNIIVKIHAFLPEEKKQEKLYFTTLIYNFAFVLRDHLRDINNPNTIEECEGLSREQFKNKNHYPNYISYLMSKKINECYRDKEFTGYQLIVLEDEMRSFLDICGACERIKKTPIPFSYSLFIKKFLMVYILTMPFGFMDIFNYWVVPVTLFVFYVLGSLELIAEEIEDPFGTDANDLPLTELSTNIKRNVKEIIEVH